MIKIMSNAKGEKERERYTECERKREGEEAMLSFMIHTHTVHQFIALHRSESITSLLCL